MPLNVSQFSSHVARTGLASPNKFQVVFDKIPTLGGFTHTHLNLMCESVSIAGRTVQSMLDRQYGVNREVAYNGPQYTPITIGFLCGGDWAEKKIFDAWNNKIVDIGNGYDVAYYDQYATGIMAVSALDRTGTQKKYTITYKECFPKSVAAIEMNHSTVNSTLRMTIEMAYAYWETDDITMGGRNTNSSPTNTGGPPSVLNPPSG